MEKVLIFSDVHDRLDLAEKLLSSKKYDHILYLGDWGNKNRELFDKYNIIAVQGNHPYETAEDVTRVIQIEGIYIFMTHGHYFSSFTEYVSNKKLVDTAKDFKPKIGLIVHGHTHVKKDEVYKGIRIINPGSLSDPRDGASRGSYIEMVVDGTEILSVTFKYIDG